MHVWFLTGFGHADTMNAYFMNKLQIIGSDSEESEGKLGANKASAARQWYLIALHRIKPTVDVCDLDGLLIMNQHGADRAETFGKDQMSGKRHRRLRKV